MAAVHEDRTEVPLVTVASERDDQMSETMIKNRNLPNPYLFEPFFCTRACYHPSPYYYLIFKAMGKPTWSTEQKSIIQALIDLGNDDFYIEVKTRVP